jgi:serine/threonine-protein kinase
MEALFFCLILPALALPGGLIYCCAIGVQALTRAGQFRGERAWALRYIGLSLCEPLINTVLVTLALTGQNLSLAVVAAIIGLTVLLPARGQAYNDMSSRDACLGALWRGLARWSISGTAILTLWINGGSGNSGVIGLVALIATVGGTVLVIHCGRWGSRLLRGPFAFPLPPAAPLPPSWPVTPYGPAAPSVNAYVARPPEIIAAPAPLDPATAIACPICEALTAREADGCEACGLVFASRIPASLLAHPGYERLRPLGDGGMSSVYIARSRSTGELCVLKTLATLDRREPEWRAEAAACLRREAHALAQIAHPGIGRLLGWEPADNGGVLVLEYVAGPTMEQRLTRVSRQGNLLAGSPLPTNEALTIGARLAETLAILALLPTPLVHCDIKPANVILAPGRGPVLVDFGGVVTLGEAGANRYGTPGYAAPEQYRGHVTARSDVYGLAATLYHALTDDDPTAKPLTFPQLNMLPELVAGLLRTALAEDPASRPTPAAFAAVLSALRL